jgi:WD40 repeat protein
MGMTMKRFIAFVALALASASAHAAPFITGDIFAATGNGDVKHYNSSGTLIETLNTGQGGYTTGMGFDSSGNLYVTNFSAGTISRFAAATGALLPPNPFASPGASPESLAFSSSGQFYVGRASGQVQRYSAAGTLQQTYGMAVNTDWIDLAANQTTLFYNDEGGQIRRWDLTTNTALADFANNSANGGTASYALRILGNGDVLSAAGSRINQYNAAGAFLGSYDVSGVDGFFALNIDPNGTSFLSGSFGNQTAYRFNIGSFGNNTQTQTLVAGGTLYGLAIAGERTVATGGVPEPATWAMLLLGFGGMGYAMRRDPKVNARIRFA